TFLKCLLEMAMLLYSVFPLFECSRLNLLSSVLISSFFFLSVLCLNSLVGSIKFLFSTFKIKILKTQNISSSSYHILLSEVLIIILLGSITSS
ncbi:hypothetical protein L9F63_026459, partial [Diploptera punctata]